MIRFLLLALATAATPALAQQPAPVATPKPEAEKPICRRETPTGSNFAIKTCHTKAEWAARSAAHADDMDKMARSRNNTAPIGN